jgi:hypothetical protein
MAGFRAPGENEGGDTKYLPAAEDTYRVRVDRYEIKEGDDSRSKYNPEGKPRVRFYLEPLFIEGDEEALMVDTSDEELPEDKFFIMFFDPDHLGLKPVVSRSRKFLAAALRVPVEQPVEAASLEEFCDTLVDRELVVDVTVNGQYNNIADSRPVVTKTRKRRKASEDKADMTEAAEAIFNEGGEDEDDY